MKLIDILLGHILLQALTDIYIIICLDDGRQVLRELFHAVSAPSWKSTELTTTICCVLRTKQKQCYLWCNPFSLEEILKLYNIPNAQPWSSLVAHDTW